MVLQNYPKIAVGIDWNRDDCINWATIENVSEYVESCDWQLGQTSGKDKMPSEGTATITLRNTDKLFSPEYTSGTLYGYMHSNLLVAIYIYDEQATDWVRVWVGYVDHYEPHPMEKAGDNQTVVHCVQGMVKLNNDTTFLYDSETTEVYADEIINRIFELTSWRSPLSGRPFIVGVSEVGDTLTVGTSGLVTVESGVRRYINIGTNWGTTEGAFRNALEDIATTEQGWWFVNRDGQLTFRNKTYLSRVKGGFDKVASTATSVSDMAYVYTDKQANVFEVIYYPNTQSTTLELWSGSELIAPGDSIQFTAMAQRDDGSGITVKGIAAIDLEGTNTASGADIYRQLVTSFTVTPRGIDVSITNPLGQEVEISGTITGLVDQKQNGMTVRRTNLAKLAEIKEPIKQVYDLPMLNTRHSATRFAEYEDYIVQDAYGCVETVTLRVRDNTSLNRILVTTTESRLLVQDSHIGLTSEFYLVSGEQFSWNPGSLEVTYVLTKMENTPDVSLLGSCTLGPTGDAVLL